MDFISPFPEQNGYNHIVVVICRLMSMVHTIPISRKSTPSQLASIFLKEVVQLHRLPESIMSNCNPKFTSKYYAKCSTTRKKRWPNFSLSFEMGCWTLLCTAVCIYVWNLIWANLLFQLKCCIQEWAMGQHKNVP
jgi:hypothetical protein